MLVEEIFRMSESSGFWKYSICWVFQALCVFVIVFDFVFDFVFVFSFDFWIAFIISFQNMYRYRRLWSQWAEILTIFEVMTDIISQSVSPIPLIDSAHLVDWAEWKFIKFFSAVRNPLVIGQVWKGCDGITINPAEKCFAYVAAFMHITMCCFLICDLFISL